MSYYIYISKSKIDVIFPSISLTEKKTIKSELSVNLGFMKAARIEEREEYKSHYDQLGIVTKHVLKKMNVGTIDEPKAWIKGKCKVSISKLPSSENAVFFLGETNATKFVLGGSSHHIVGDNLDVSESESMSFAPRLVDALEKRFEDLDLSGEKDEITEITLTHRMAQKGKAWAQQIEKMLDSSRGVQYQVEFLAKRLVTTEMSGNQYILATPLYVMMND